MAHTKFSTSSQNHQPDQQPCLDTLSHKSYTHAQFLEMVLIWMYANKNSTQFNSTRCE